MQPLVRITKIEDFSYDHNNGNWNGKAHVEIRTDRGQVEIEVPFQKAGDLLEAQMAVLNDVGKWAKGIAQGAEKALREIPPRR